jgi:hypothetical protein
VIILRHFGYDHIANAQLNGHMIQVVTVDYFGTCLCKKSLFLFGKFQEKIFRYHGIQDGITQVFQAFIVNLDIVEDKMGCRFVDKGKLIQFEIPGPESKYPF